MRDASIAVLRKIGVECGGSNVQFAISPTDGRMLVIEMNPRVSRSSALASKATGFPIAKVAAKLAVGYTLDELRNDITGGATPASFEPTIDYVVTKIPRFTFEKFPGRQRPPDDADEVGRRGHGDGPHVPGVAAEGAARPRDRHRRPDADRRLAAGRRRRAQRAARRDSACRAPHRLRYVADAFRAGMTLDEVHRASRIDPWFLAQIEDLVREEAAVAPGGLAALDARAPAHAQAQGLCRQPARAACSGIDRKDRARAPPRLRRAARSYKRVDTCAAEFATSTAYMYSTYEEECEAAPTEQPQDHDPRRRPEPHRAGHRVRLLLRARGARAARGRVRDHHGQLQPGDGLHRLRHVRSAVFRAAHVRRRHGDHARREARRRDRAVRRTDAAQAREGARRGGRADHRHEPGFDRRRRRSRALPAAGGETAAAAAAEPHRAHRRRSGASGRAKSASRWWCARVTCSAAARWKWCSPKTTCVPT